MTASALFDAAGLGLSAGVVVALAVGVLWIALERAIGLAMGVLPTRPTGPGIRLCRPQEVRRRPALYSDSSRPRTGPAGVPNRS